MPLESLKSFVDWPWFPFVTGIASVLGCLLAIYPIQISSLPPSAYRGLVWQKTLMWAGGVGLMVFSGIQFYLQDPPRDGTILGAVHDVLHGRPMRLEREERVIGFADGVVVNSVTKESTSTAIKELTSSVTNAPDYKISDAGGTRYEGAGGTKRDASAGGGRTVNDAGGEITSSGKGVIIGTNPNPGVVTGSSNDRGVVTGGSNNRRGVTGGNDGAGSATKPAFESGKPPTFESSKPPAFESGKPPAFDLSKRPGIDVSNAPNISVSNVPGYPRTMLTASQEVNPPRASQEVNPPLRAMSAGTSVWALLFIVGITLAVVGWSRDPVRAAQKRLHGEWEYCTKQREAFRARVASTSPYTELATSEKENVVAQYNRYLDIVQMATIGLVTGYPVSPLTMRPEFAEASVQADLVAAIYKALGAEKDRPEQKKT